MAGNLCTRYAREISKRHRVSRVIVVLVKPMPDGKTGYTIGGTVLAREVRAMLDGAALEAYRTATPRNCRPRWRSPPGKCRPPARTGGR